MMKHLKLIKIRNMMNVKKDLFQCFITFFDKKTSGGAIKKELCKIKN